MNYKLKQSNRKTIAIRVVDGGVTVYAPFGVDRRVIEGFVQSKTPWIEKKLALYRKTGLDVFSDKEAVLFGHKVAIECSVSSVTSVVLDDQLLHVTYRANASKERVNRAVEDALKEKLDAIIQLALHEYCQALHLHLPSYMIRKYKRMYGRCSSNGSLGFNTYLYHERPAFIRYVVLHECAHLIEFNHSKRFYAIIESIMPDYKTIINQQKTEQVVHPDQ